MNERLEFVILGRTALRRNGEHISLGAAQQRGLLALLLYHVGDPVRADAIVEHLWTGRTIEECRENVHTLVSRIRSALSRAGVASALVHVPSVGGYRLDVHPELIDFHRFRRLLHTARDAAEGGSHRTAVAHLTAAVDLWRDEPLADLRQAHAEPLRTHMNETLLEAHRLLIQCEMALGRHHAALARLEPLLSAHRTDEILAQHWIAGLAATGRQAEARTFYTAFRSRFHRQMHAEPHIDLPPDLPLDPHPTRQRATDRSNPPQPRSALSEAPSGLDGPRQLPPDISDFTGHRDLLARLDTLADPRQGHPATVIAITGMPGVGKTTLATHWAHTKLDRFPDGQLYLDAHTDGPSHPMEPSDALGRFLQDLDVPADRIPLGIDRRRDRLNRLLHGRRMIIILDNVRDSAQARSLLATSDTCLTLVTSRRRLKGLSIREAVPNLTVAPLPAHESTALLTGLIGSSRARAEPDAVRYLAQLSGGLPLALRIVGERVAERPLARVADLAEDLGTRLVDDGEDDETSLYKFFAWSYDALAPDAARLFRLLGLHPGPTICRDSAAAVAATDLPHAERLLDALAQVHLINHDVARRYRFHDLLRRYAADLAVRRDTFEDRRAAMHRLLDWYLLTAVNAVGVLAPGEPPVPDLPDPSGFAPQEFPTATQAMAWYEAERENLFAITRWATENGFHRRGWQIPGTIHEVLDRYGRQHDILLLEQTALSAAHADGRQDGIIGSMNNLGAAYFGLHDYRSAADIFGQALRLSQQFGLAAAETVCSLNFASAQLKTGAVDEAIALYTHILNCCRSQANPLAEAAALRHIADGYRKLRRYDEAVAAYRAALAIQKETGSSRAQAVTLGALADLYRETGLERQALAHGQQALDIYVHTRDDGAHCDALTTMADVKRALGRHRAAARDAQRAVAISDGLGDSQRRCHALAVLVDTLVSAGDVETAVRLCTEATVIIDQLDNPEARALRQRITSARYRLALPSPGAQETPAG